jgi:hypothetical protein
MIGRLTTSNFADQGRKITASDTAPSSAIEGDLWYKTDVGATLIYYDGFWIELSGGGYGGGSDFAPQIMLLMGV